MKYDNTDQNLYDIKVPEVTSKIFIEKKLVVEEINHRPFNCNIQRCGGLYVSHEQRELQKSNINT